MKKILVIVMILLAFCLSGLDKSDLSMFPQKKVRVIINATYYVEETDMYVWDSYLQLQDDSEIEYPLRTSTEGLSDKYIELVKSERYDMFLTYYFSPHDGSIVGKGMSVEETYSYHELKILKKLNDLPIHLLNRIKKCENI